MALVLKTSVSSRAPWVRIPPSPLKQNQACPVGGRPYQFLVDQVLIGDSTSLFVHWPLNLSCFALVASRVHPFEGDPCPNQSLSRGMQAKTKSAMVCLTEDMKLTIQISYRQTHCQRPCSDGLHRANNRHSLFNWSRQSWSKSDLEHQRVIANNILQCNLYQHEKGSFKSIHIRYRTLI